MRILCIGDSNTWGYNPASGQRYANRWTRVLAKLMPENEIIEEGLNGRTVLSVDPVKPERCGISALKMLLMSHKPIDLVIVMLGTNELKNFFKCDANYIAEGIGEFIKIIKSKELWQSFNIPKLLVISPILIRDELIENGDVFGDFDEKSVAESRLLATAIAEVCEENNIAFMNAADYAKASLVDNVHLDEENHRKLAEAIDKKLRDIKLSGMNGNI